MPVLHSEFKGMGQMPDGTIVPVPGALGLILRGPCVPVTVHVPDQFEAELVRRDKPVPCPVSGLALIDTGASSTCIDEEVAEKLGLPVINVVDMASASHASIKAKVYPAKLVMSGGLGTIVAPSCIGGPLAAQSKSLGSSLTGPQPQLVALIGRDVLAKFLRIYDGGNGRFTLCM